ncbi:carbohydrate ABC transporter permease [Nesterenkonia haasae]|uniref:carbohydrate ABC transporter permease n=1 Tax=Nesterenkonia haasae TaxID=2587813 RepID=UPI0013920279|nr:sugar ABC transporter permease [Nesterenkonia haasae]
MTLLERPNSQVSHVRSPQPSPTPKVKRRFTHREPLVLLAPALILVGVFAGIPLVRSLWFAFNEVNPFEGVTGFVGFENFVTAVSNPAFGSLLSNTAMWTFGAVGLQLIFGLLGALLLNARFPLRGVYRGLAMIPWATPSVLVALMWMWILDPNHGILNKALMGVGIIDSPVALLSQTSTALPTLIVIDVWQGIPLFAVMILAALQAVPPELKESASIDGAGRWGVFRHVVIPTILPTILITTILRLIWTANYIDLPFILTGGGPGNASTTLALQSYVTAYKGSDFGTGAAYVVMQAAILAIFIVMYVRLTRKAELK